jgi:hypothetical protein
MNAVRWSLALVVLCFAGCASTTKTTISLYVEKDVWVDRNPLDTPDGKIRLEYKVLQDEPWPFFKKVEDERRCNPAKAKVN